MITEPLFQIQRLTEKCAQRMLSIPSEVALSLFNSGSVERNFLLPRYHQLIRKHAAHLPQLDQEGAKIVAGLDRQGIYQTNLENLGLPNTAQFLAAAHTISAELAQMTQTPRYQGRHTLTGKASQFLKYPDIFWWGAAERLLTIVESYLRLPVAYDAFSFYYSVADGKDAGPRKWHRDKEDWKMVKICVYLCDVDEDSGPYECVKPTFNQWLLDTIQPRYKTLTHREMQQVLGADSSDWSTSYTGKAGTVLFVDTAQYYHRGKPPTANDRSALFFSYFSRVPKNPFYCERSPLSMQQLANLASSLPAHVQDSILWKERMQSVARFIPKNRVTV